MGQPSLALMLASLGAKSAAQLWDATVSLRTYRSTLLDAMDRDGVDVLLAAPYATPALPHGGSKDFTLASSYAIVFNATQLPAGVVPRQARVRASEAHRAAGRDLFERRAAKVDARSAGLPIGVQVVGRAWHDHEVLAVMRAIESAFRDDEEYPRTPAIRRLAGA